MPSEETTIDRRKGAYLPHFKKQGGIYAVTMRLHDSLPSRILEQWKGEREDIVKLAETLKRPLSEIEEKSLQELYSEKIEEALDRGHGACWMRDPRIAGVIADALAFFMTRGTHSLRGV